MSYLKEEAIKFLKELQGGSIIYFEIFRELELTIAAGIIGYDELGISKEELESLWKRNCEYVAKSWLKDLRMRIEEPEICVYWLRRALKDGELTLENIGTNEEELLLYLNVHP